MASTLHLYTNGTDPFTVDLGDVSLVIHAGSPPEVPPATQPGPGPVKGPNPTKPFKPTPKKPPYGYLDAPTSVADLSGILDKLPKSKRSIGMTVGSAKSAKPAQQWLTLINGLGKRSVDVHVVDLHRFPKGG